MQFTITFDTYIIGFIIIIISAVLLIINWIFRYNFYFHTPKGSMRPMEEHTLFYKDEFYRNILLFAGSGLFGGILMLI